MGQEVESWEDSGADPYIVAWFLHYEKMLIEFAEKNNLTIRKFYKDTPAYHFLFRHPCNGECWVDLRKEGEESFSLKAIWIKDDYDSGTRSTKELNIAEPVPEDKLLSKIRELLAVVLKWDEKDLTTSSSDNTSIWHSSSTKKEFERIQNRFPLPKLSTNDGSTT